MNNNPDTNDNGEISLIDLFAILLRYRKLIVGITICAFIVVIAGYFFYPSWRKNNARVTKIYETSVSISLTPGARYIFSNQANQSFVPYFYYPQVIQAALEDTKQGPVQSKEILRWLPVLKLPVSGDERIFESSNKMLVMKENVRSNVLEITCKGNDSQSGIIFLKSFFLHGSVALENFIKPLAISFIDTYEAASLPPADNNNYVLVKALVNGKMPGVVQLFEPYVLEVEETTKKTRYRIVALAILSVAILFSIFLAFFLNALENIKNDQQIMGKLRAALGKVDAKHGTENQ
ncbi:MAG: hypothetical protein LBH44_08455 [Treponema sp.]|jgi:hypothetical protein|nr:hypothetical protein [Treponema sp.]